MCGTCVSHEFLTAKRTVNNEQQVVFTGSGPFDEHMGYCEETSLRHFGSITVGLCNRMRSQLMLIHMQPSSLSSRQTSSGSNAPQTKHCCTRTRIHSGAKSPPMRASSLDDSISALRERAHRTKRCRVTRKYSSPSIAVSLIIL